MVKGDRREMLLVCVMRSLGPVLGIMGGAAMLGGCAAGERFVEVTADHPASPQAAAGLHERSETLVHFDPVDPQPARSEFWAHPPHDVHEPHHEPYEPEEPEHPHRHHHHYHDFE